MVEPVADLGFADVRLGKKAYKYRHRFCALLLCTTFVHYVYNLLRQGLAVFYGAAFGLRPALSDPTQAAANQRHALNAHDFAAAVLDAGKPRSLDAGQLAVIGRVE